jgi:uncharacterized protein
MIKLHILMSGVIGQEASMEKQDTFLEAVKAGDRDTVKQMLVEDRDLVNARDKEGRLAVVLAIYFQKPQVADLLIEWGAVLDIFAAAASGRQERVSELLEQDPEQISSFAEDGFQPLGLASFFGHIQVVELLLLKGVEVDTPSQNQQKVRPLHSAVAGRHEAIVRMLLENGADPNAVQTGGFTPLHSAAQNGDKDIARLLLDYGANASAITDDGQTPLDLASTKGHKDVAILLKDQPVDE